MHERRVFASFLALLLNLAEFYLFSSFLSAHQRHLPNLQSLSILFFTRKETKSRETALSKLPGDGYSVVLPAILEYLGPTLLHLAIRELNEYKPYQLHSSSPLPFTDLSHSPSLRTLAVNSLRLERFWDKHRLNSVRAKPHHSLEELVIGPPEGEAKEGIFSYGLELWDPTIFSIEHRDRRRPPSGIVGEMLNGFSKKDYPSLKRVRLTCASWERTAHRHLNGLERNVMALRKKGIELVDREGRFWYY